MHALTRNLPSRRPIAAVLLACSLAACNLARQPAAATGTPSPVAALTAQALLTRSVEQTLAARSPSPSPVTTLVLPITPVAATLTPASCADKATFVDDVTVRDNTEMDPNEAFVKVWRLQNSGSCTWTPSYALGFIGGDRMGAPSRVPVPTRVAPGNTVDFAVDMTAPASPGTYQGFWKLVAPSGDYFGIGPDADQSFWVKIVVPTSASQSDTPTATTTATRTMTPSPSATGLPSATFSPTPSGTASAIPSATPSPSATSTATASATLTDTPSP